MSAWKRLLLAVFAGALSLSAVPWMLSCQRAFFLKKEVFFSSPLPARTLRIRSDSYGKGYFGASRNGKRTHLGIDLEAVVGTPVLASKSGRVMTASVDRGYGTYVALIHPDGLESRYAHLSSVSVKEGDWVAMGRPIGKSGRTGNAAHPRITPHLHYEICLGKASLDPIQSGLLDPSLAVK